MNLADEMEVSYQAVSNWERGNSMPDIGKLEQLCQILQIGIDELLGADTAKGLTKLMHQDPDAGIVTLEEIREFVPMLHPEYVKKVVGQNLGGAEESQEGQRKLSPQMMIGLAPFLSPKVLNELSMRAKGRFGFEEISMLAPFLDDSKVLKTLVMKMRE